jgi:ribosomal protein S25
MKTIEEIEKRNKELADLRASLEEKKEKEKKYKEDRDKIAVYIKRQKGEGFFNEIIL